MSSRIAIGKFRAGGGVSPPMLMLEEKVNM